MSKITQKAAKRIAKIINTMEVAEIMVKDQRDEQRYERADYYRQQYYAAVLALHNEFAIPLPNVELAQEKHDESIYPLSWV